MFSRDSNSPGIRDAMDAGVSNGATPDPLIALTDVPMTLSGLSHFNVENVLAATSAALGLGLSRATVIQGLRTFELGPAHTPGRMNISSLGATTVIMDLAHNEVGVTALLEVMNGLRRPGAQLLPAMGTAGDRTEELLSGLAEIAARDTDLLVIVQKESYLRGRSAEEMDSIFRAAAAGVGVDDVPSFPDELSGLEALVAEARADDVIGVMCHTQREILDAWIREHGGSLDSPDVLRDKVVAAAQPAPIGREVG